MLFVFGNAGPLHREARVVVWHENRSDSWVLNVDGSCVLDAGRSGIGGLLHDGDGDSKLSFSGFIGDGNSLRAELLALLHGLGLAWDHGCRYLVCYTDSQMTFDLISSPPEPTHQYATIIEGVKALFRRQWVVDLRHTLREGNASADFLAILGSQSDTPLTLWEFPPEGIGTLLMANARRIPFLRD